MKVNSITKKKYKQKKMFSIMDIVAAFIAGTTWILLCLFRVLSIKFLWWFLIGFVIGSVWEWVHFAVPDFIQFTNTTTTKSLAIKILSVIAHSIWDSFILIIAALLVLGLKIKLKSVCALMMMIVFCVAQEIIVELIFNGRVWVYNDQNKANPILFHIGRVNYTLWPILEWLLAPILFWTIVIHLP